MMSRALSHFDRRDPFEREVFSRLKEIFLSEADDEHLRALESFTFALVKPDAFARGLAPEVIERLKDSGFTIGAIRLAEMDSDMIDELYMFVKQRYADSWWIMPKVFSQAPVVAIVLVREEGDASSKLREVVGPTTPEAGKPGNIRYDMKGANRALNVIHAADDPASALREALVFFEMDEVLDAMLSSEDASYDSAELSPEEPVSLSRWACFNSVKVEALDFLEAGRYELQEVLDKEAEVVSKDLPLDDERIALMDVEAQISLKASNLVRELESEAIRIARMPADPSGKGRLGEKIEDSITAVKLIELLSDEVKLMREDRFDMLLLSALSMGLVDSEWDEVVLHSTWAVMPQMVSDLRRANKVVITSLEET
ncbi:MAG: nucleoside-diphosphate kinase [Candidatus Korarchaeum sp.]|nr:nucleoside-diphosphate kinase [Candidatus Korarchaeum sp.]MDW8036321.1 nucleoside-diphosphate kinase [Candidatus Korarchaeum sp.]